ncbi:putative glycosyl hydrolase [Nemania sp. FL0916]|nr:putative glycosyl hydrolase [Nemania sp. FL0916]
MGFSTSKPSPSSPPKSKLDYTTCEAGNPFVAGWYADPGAAYYDGVFWVYPTTSLAYSEQTYVDAFSSPDLVHWTKHPKVLTTENISWAERALWAPAPVRRGGRFYLYFSANDIQEDELADEEEGNEGGGKGKGKGKVGGIGVAVADKPEGPYVDAIGKPLIGGYHNGAQPIDQDVFVDDEDGDGKAYIYYGGHGHANVALLNEDMISLSTFPSSSTTTSSSDKDAGTDKDANTFREITPAHYVEGARMLKRRGKYYFMWSEGSWLGADYRVAYAISSSPLGPFDRKGVILQQDSAVALGAGHNSVLRVPVDKDEEGEIWYMVYHRRPLSETDANHRVLAYDRLYFKDGGDDEGGIEPVKMLVRDNFADGAMHNWTTYSGSWSVEDARLTVRNSGSGMAMLDTDFADQIFDATINTTSGNGHPGLLFRVTELSKETQKYKGYKAAISPSGVITFGKADLGTFTDLAQTRMQMQVGVEYRVRVRAVGSEFEIFVDDMESPKIKFTDGSFTHGANGVRVFNAAAKFGEVSVAKA